MVGKRGGKIGKRGKNNFQIGGKWQGNTASIVEWMKKEVEKERVNEKMLFEGDWRSVLGVILEGDEMMMLE